MFFTFTKKSPKILIFSAIFSATVVLAYQICNYNRQKLAAHDDVEGRQTREKYKSMLRSLTNNDMPSTKSFIECPFRKG